MRAEDLFEAIGGIDEDLIARSEMRAKAAQKELKGAEAGQGRNSAEAAQRRKISEAAQSQKSAEAAQRRKIAAHKRRRRARIYKYTVIALASAAAVFMLLMVRDFTGSDRLNTSSEQGTEVANNSNLPKDTQIEAAEDSQDDEARTESEGAPRASQEAEKETDSDRQADAATQSDEAGQAGAGGQVGAGGQDGVAQSQDAGRANAPGQAGADSQAEAGSQAAEAGTESNGGKEPVDLLGDRKGDYVNIEYISAADEANGGSRKVPEYTEEGERALSAALGSGKAKPAVMVKKGEPTYYVYLTDSKGKVDKVTFYENGYVSMDSIPGMVMKVPDDEYAEVMELFE